MSLLARIEAKHFVAGIVLDAAKVTEAAPIVRYMTGWSAKQVKTYCDTKGWRIARVNDEPHTPR